MISFTKRLSTAFGLFFLCFFLVLLFPIYAQAWEAHLNENGDIEIYTVDKKRMKLNEAGLPQAVIDQTPKLLRRSKLPILKVRVGNRVMSLICDEKIFDNVPVKKEVKASVSGIYVTEVKGLHGKVQAPEQKKGFFKNLVAKAQEKAGAKMVK